MRKCKNCVNSLYSEHDPSNGHRVPPECIFRIRKNRMQVALIEQAMENHDTCPFYCKVLTDKEFLNYGRGEKMRRGKSNYVNQDPIFEEIVDWRK